MATSSSTRLGPKKVARCAPGAGVRKPPGEETAGGGVGGAAWAMGIWVPRMRWVNGVEAVQQTGGW